MSICGLWNSRIDIGLKLVKRIESKAQESNGMELGDTSSYLMSCIQIYRWKEFESCISCCI